VKFHPFADVFPLLEGNEFETLVEDVKVNGLIVPIVMHEGKILDGRNRYRACMEAGVEPSTRDYDGNDPLSYVISLNLQRRHMNESQRAMVAARLATLKDGQRSDRQGAQICAPTQEDAADLLNVSRRSVQSARVVLDKGTSELVRAAEQGKVPVSLAEKIAAADPDVQDAVVRRIETEEIRPLEAFRIEKGIKVQQRRLLEPTGKYRVVYADPPWDYGNPMPLGFGDARDHYPTMPLEDICALPVKDWVEDDAVLFLWTTSPNLEKSFAVVNAWGFEYKANFVWDKERQVMGHYNGVAHEFLLICTRGNCTPDVRKLFYSVVREKRTERSKKPAVFYDIIETLYPHGTRLELFQRGAGRKGWECYELESTDDGFRSVDKKEAA